MATKPITITSTMVDNINRDALVDYCKIALAERGEDVRRELNTIGSLDSVYRMRHATVFSVYSPQADFVPNCSIIAPVLASILAGVVDASVYDDACRQNGYYMLTKSKVDNKHIGMISLAEVVKIGVLPNFAELQNFAGIGPKVASMATALNDEHARVFTLDTWMFGATMELNVCYTKRQKQKYAIGDKAYAQLVELYLSIADELHVSPFMLQWSVWCYRRGNKHETHLPIFGIVE